MRTSAINWIRCLPMNRIMMNSKITTNTAFHGVSTRAEEKSGNWNTFFQLTGCQSSAREEMYKKKIQIILIILKSGCNNYNIPCDLRGRAQKRDDEKKSNENFEI